MKKVIIVFLLILFGNLYGENKELVEGGIVKYDRHTHIVGIYCSPEEAEQIYEDRSKHFLLNYDKVKVLEFSNDGAKGKINIFTRKNKKDIYCFVMVEGTKVIYASEIPQDDCAIVKKFLK